MKESEAWFLLAEELEYNVGKGEFFTCHILSNLLQEGGRTRWGTMVFEIPVTTVWKMKDRFRAHTKNDNRDDRENPMSWYMESSSTGFRTYNPMRVMAYTWLGFEALEEEDAQ
jgi:hypothetical protein